ncbi:MAG: LpxL/LpxP family Kdo(2)-lipid IV(A) lauroyl/palmitoleoyl acyltransferase [Gammaproteobacteria bacterium]
MRNSASFLTIRPMNEDFVPLYRFWKPRFWPAWIVLGILRLIVSLPQSLRMACGRGLGRLARRLLKSRRHIAEVNVRICFPELSEKEIDLLTVRHFESLGMGVIELGMAWWCSDKQLARLITVKGTESLLELVEQGQAVLMLSGHFALTEIAGRAMQPLLPPMAAMYRPSDNPMNDQIMRRCRGRSTPELITKTSIRRLVKLLKSNYPIWYASDQAYWGKGAELIPFFSEPAMTNTSLSQIARLGKATVVPFAPRRINNGERYEIEYLPPLDNFPSDDAISDAKRVNEFLEQRIRIAPEQYYWVHRRFKARPKDYPDPYQ